MLSLGAAALAAVALVPATASAGHGHWGGGTVATVGTATGMAVAVGLAWRPSLARSLGSWLGLGLGAPGLCRPPLWWMLGFGL